MEAFADNPAPYYHGYLERSKWHLGYPLAMFEQIVRNGLVGLRSYLEANDINPYAALDDTQRW